MAHENLFVVVHMSSVLFQDNWKLWQIKENDYQSKWITVQDLKDGM